MTPSDRILLTKLESFIIFPADLDGCEGSIAYFEFGACSSLPQILLIMAETTYA